MKPDLSTEAHALMRSRCRFVDGDDEDDGHGSFCSDVALALDRAYEAGRESMRAERDGAVALLRESLSTKTMAADIMQAYVRAVLRAYQARKALEAITS